MISSKTFLRNIQVLQSEYTATLQDTIGSKIRLHSSAKSYSA